MTKRETQLLSAVARKRGDGQAASASAYLRATVRPGKTLERLITSEQALPRCPVVLTNVGQAARRIGEGKVIAVRGPVDFIGTVRASGRSILFDAKECGRANFDCNTSAVKQHQIEELVRHGQARALAGLMVLDTSSGVVVWLDWRRLAVRLPTYPWASMPRVGTLGRGVAWDTLATWEVWP